LRIRCSDPQFHAPKVQPIPRLQQGLRDSLTVDLNSVALRTAEIGNHEPFVRRRIDHRVIPVDGCILDAQIVVILSSDSD